jgi:large subunit ribosomal protein L13
VDTLSYKTISANKATAKKNWLVVDAENEVVGRLAAKVAYLLRGKHKTDYTPHVDSGDNVIIINAEKVRFTGKKKTDKVYTRHTGYPGGQRLASPSILLQKKPTEILRHAIAGMLPKTKMGDVYQKNVHIFAGTEHNHVAQQPKAVDLKTIIA